MEINNLLPITTRKELRIWLENNHLTSSCCWVLTTRKPSPHALLYLDAVEEALCFGWIDSTRKRRPPVSWPSVSLPDPERVNGPN